MAGQPTKYNKEMLKDAKRYTKDCTEFEQIIPSVSGLATALGVSKQTLYNWADIPENKEFFDTLQLLHTNQETKLLNGGLSGNYNAQITKLMLANHGYSDQPKTQETQKPVVNIINPNG